MVAQFQQVNMAQIGAQTVLIAVVIVNISHHNGAAPKGGDLHAPAKPVGIHDRSVIAILLVIVENLNLGITEGQIGASHRAALRCFGVGCRSVQGRNKYSTNLYGGGD